MFFIKDDSTNEVLQNDVFASCPRLIWAAALDVISNEKISVDKEALGISTIRPSVGAVANKL